MARKAKKASAKRKKKSAVKRKTARKSTKKTKRASGKSKRVKVSAIPKGYYSVIPYLIINNAARAIEFYKKAFGAKEVLRMDQPGGKIGHAELKIGDAKVMLADEFPEMEARSPLAYGGTPVGIHLYLKNVDAAVERAMGEGAKVLKPIENMFYGDRSCTLEDPFGHKWYVSTHVENVTPREMKKRAAELFGYK